VSEQDELERGILAAHAAGDRRELERLQARYRAGDWTTRPAAPAGLRSSARRAGPPRLTVTTATRGSVTTSSSAGAGSVTGRPAVARVLVTRDAYDALVRHPELGLGRELAGGLYGRVERGELVVEALSSAYLDSSTYRAELDEQALLHGLDAAVARRCGWELVGHWHSHATGLEPSRADRDNWQAWALEHGPFLGLIAAPSCDPARSEAAWLYPRLGAWLATAGQVRSLPLRVEPPES
jgi:hypothetical protein